MSEEVDARVAELLISRMCHDLVGPLGAVCNGLELAGEGGEFAGEALGMAENCATQLSSRVKYFRMAYGMAGRVITNVPELRGLAIAYLEDGAAGIDWPLPPVAPNIQEGEGKLLLNMISIATDALPRCGTVKIDLEGDDIIVDALSDKANISSELISSLEFDGDGVAEDLSPRNVHGYWTSIVALRVGRRLKWEHLSAGEGIRFAAV